MTLSKIHLLKLSFILLLSLLIFGANFSKMNLTGALHLFDFLFVLLFLVSLLFLKTILPHKPILIISVLSIFYLFYSFSFDARMDFIIRQYALFGYLVISYLIFANLLNKNNIDFFIKQIINLSIFGFLLQILFFIYLNIVGKFSFSGYHYWSPMIVMAIITFAAYTMTYHKKIKLLFLYGTAIFVSTTLGHSSAFLAIFILPFTLLFIKSSKIMKIFTLIIGFTLTLALFIFIPSFSDANAMWRIYYWFMTFKNILVDHFALFGNGFGVPYASEEIAYFLQVEQGATTRLGQNDESCITPFHNSFITIFFHIGFLPGILIFYPFYKFIKNYRILVLNKEAKFLFLSLVGMSAWSSLNVVLELPHSSFFYWTVYFVLLFKMKEILAR